MDIDINTFDLRRALNPYERSDEAVLWIYRQMKALSYSKYGSAIFNLDKTLELYGIENVSPGNEYNYIHVINKFRCENYNVIFHQDDGDNISFIIEWNDKYPRYKSIIKVELPPPTPMVSIK